MDRASIFVLGTHSNLLLDTFVSLKKVVSLNRRGVARGPYSHTQLEADMSRVEVSLAAILILAAILNTYLLMFALYIQLPELKHFQFNIKLL
jgi:hypothetical protein